MVTSKRRTHTSRTGKERDDGKLVVEHNDEVKVTDPREAPLDADVEAHKKLDQVSDDEKRSLG